MARGADAVRMNDFFAGSIEEAWRRTSPFIPQRYKEEMRGVADGAGLPLKDIQFANIFPALFHCSGFAVFGEATKGGRLLHGRILDYLSKLGLQDHAVTIIAKPNGAGPAAKAPIVQGLQKRIYLLSKELQEQEIVS